MAGGGNIKYIFPVNSSSGAGQVLRLGVVVTLPV